MANYKALKIEKEMTEMFGEFPKLDIQKLMDSECFDHPHITKRDDCERAYCNIVVTNGFGWYRDLDGFEFFCEVDKRYCNLRKYYIIRGYNCVRLTNTKRIIFRGFRPEDVTIV